MVQAVLLVHFGQLVRLVALAAVGYHNPGVVGGNQFPYFLISMLIPNLVHPGLVGVKSHPMCSLPVNAPASVIGIGTAPGPLPLSTVGRHLRLHPWTVSAHPE